MSVFVIYKNHFNDIKTYIEFDNSNLINISNTLITNMRNKDGIAYISNDGELSICTLPSEERLKEIQTECETSFMLNDIIGIIAGDESMKYKFKDLFNIDTDLDHDA